MLYRNRLALNELKICCFSITEGYTRAERNGSLSSRQTLAHTRKSHSAVFPITNGTLPLFFFSSVLIVCVAMSECTVFYEVISARK